MTSLADMELVTSDTSGTCVKCFLDRENVSKINEKVINFVKFAKFRQELSQNNWSEFVLE